MSGRQKITSVQLLGPQSFASLAVFPLFEK
jgi:hypothetical protein